MVGRPAGRSSAATSPGNWPTCWLSGATSPDYGSARAGDWSAAHRLARLLAEHDDIDGAIEVLQARVDAGDSSAGRRLAGLLAERGDIDELWERTNAGDWPAGRLLADVLAQLDRPEEADRLRRSASIRTAPLHPGPIDNPEGNRRRFRDGGPRLG